MERLRHHLNRPNIFQVPCPSLRLALVFGVSDFLHAWVFGCFVIDLIRRRPIEQTLHPAKSPRSCFAPAALDTRTGRMGEAGSGMREGEIVMKPPLHIDPGAGVV
jgi:hypothetical protein